MMTARANIGGFQGGLGPSGTAACEVSAPSREGCADGVGEERAEGILFKVLGVGGEHQEFVLGGMGETKPRETKKDNKIQETTRNCPVRGNIIIVNFELQAVSINCEKKFREKFPAHHSAHKEDIVRIAHGCKCLCERVAET
jgi:hypothetical protein